MSEDVFVIPASFAQQRLWFLDQLEPGTPAYNIPAALHLKGQLQTDVLARSLNEVVRRHEALRTRFAVAENDLVQVIPCAATVELPVTDLRHLEAQAREQTTRALIDKEARCSFDLTTGPLLRVAVLRLSDEEHVLLLTLHHIIADGWSMNILVREVSLLYEAFARGVESPLPELPIQYADFAVWQREHLSGAVLEEQIRYWKERLAASPPVLELPKYRALPLAKSMRGARQPVFLGAELSAQLKQLSRSQGVTLFMTLMAAFNVLLQRNTGHRDILIGTPIAGRTRPETKNLIGFFVNMLIDRKSVV